MNYIRRLRYEYWPWYLFFIPVLPVCIYWMIRTGKVLYFTAANPGIYLGGFFGESKSEILDQIPEKFKPFSKRIKPGDVIVKSAFHFPLILKPDIGERGNGVQLIKDQNALNIALGKLSEPHILQQYVNDPIELGVFYHRYPDGSGSGISSVTLKGMMAVTGDGVSNIEQLMAKDLRSSLQIHRLRKEKPDLLMEVPALEETVLLEPRGNHCLGTEFINASHLINSHLVALFDEITAHFEGFYYGRFDVKIRSTESLEEGNVMIFELNGVSSEPGHIYDKQYNVLKAYKDVAAHWMIMGKISEMNIKRGIKPAPLKLFLNTVIHHFKS